MSVKVYLDTSTRSDVRLGKDRHGHGRGADETRSFRMGEKIRCLNISEREALRASAPILSSPASKPSRMRMEREAAVAKPAPTAEPAASKSSRPEPTAAESTQDVGEVGPAHHPLVVVLAHVVALPLLWI